MFLGTRSTVNLSRGKSFRLYSVTLQTHFLLRTARLWPRSWSSSPAPPTSSAWRASMPAAGAPGLRSPPSRRVCPASPGRPPPSRSQSPRTGLTSAGSRPAPAPGTLWSTGGSSFVLMCPMLTRVMFQCLPGCQVRHHLGPRRHQDCLLFPLPARLRPRVLRPQRPVRGPQLQPGRRPHRHHHQARHHLQDRRQE